MPPSVDDQRSGARPALARSWLIRLNRSPSTVELASAAAGLAHAMASDAKAAASITPPRRAYGGVRNAGNPIGSLPAVPVAPTPLAESPGVGGYKYCNGINRDSMRPAAWQDDRRCPPSSPS